MSQREVKIAIQVQDDCETFCSARDTRHNCYWGDLGGWCRLFEINREGKENGRKHERCPECLEMEIHST